MLAAALASSAPQRPASAQVVRSDSASVLLATAADFEGRGEMEAAEALYRHIADRFDDTAAAETARAWLEAAAGRQSQAGGETELKVWSTTYGIWLGLMVPLALDANGPEPYGAGLLLGAPAGFFGSRAFARSRPLSLGQARAITWGGTWGAFHGLAWASAFNLGGGDRLVGGEALIHEEESEEAVFASMIVGSAMGVAGGALAARREIAPGTATSATLGTLWGAWFGLGSSILFDLDEDPTWATVMLAGDAGLVAGALAGSRWRLSRSRARLISVGGLIGTVAGFGVVLLADTSDEDVAIGVAMTGSVAGLALGAALTRGHAAEEDISGDGQAAGVRRGAGALFNWSQDGWSLSAPLPSPVPDPGLRSSGRGGAGGMDGLVWKVPLLNVRF